MIDTNIIVTLVSSLFSGILASYITTKLSKYTKDSEEYQNRKIKIFTKLMTTRNARASINHVEALNMIDFAFYGLKGKEKKRTESEKSVLNSWIEYYQHLKREAKNNEELPILLNERDNLFVNLLENISKDINYVMPRHDIKDGSYFPRMYEDLDFEQNYLRRLAIDLLNGSNSIKINLNDLPDNYKSYLTNLEQIVKQAVDNNSIKIELNKKDNF